MLSNQFFKLLFSIVFFILLSGCSINKDKSIRLGMNTWPGYEPFILAKELNYLSENVYISRLDSATDVVKSFKSDIIDIACLTLDEAIVLQHNSNDDITIIATIDFSAGGDAIIANKTIKNMADLKGKKVGVESSALGAFMISRAVDLTPNLEINDIRIIDVGYEHHMEKFINKDIDAVVTFEPVKTKLLPLEYWRREMCCSTQLSCEPTHSEPRYGCVRKYLPREFLRHHPHQVYQLIMTMPQGKPALNMLYRVI